MANFEKFSDILCFEFRFVNFGSPNLEAENIPGFVEGVLFTSISYFYFIQGNSIFLTVTSRDDLAWMIVVCGWIVNSLGGPAADDDSLAAEVSSPDLGRAVPSEGTRILTSKAIADSLCSVTVREDAKP